MNNYERFKSVFRAFISILPLWERVIIKIDMFFYELWYWRIGSLLWRWFKIDVVGGDDD